MPLDAKSFEFEILGCKNLEHFGIMPLDAKASNSGLGVQKPQISNF